MYETQRTGVRLVLTNATDLSRIDDYNVWYDSYGAALTRPGFLANDFRFENPDAAGTKSDPRFVAIYDIVTSDPAMAWPNTEMSPDYPTTLFDDPRSALVAPAFRASYALVGSQERPGHHGPLTGVYLTLTDGADDTSRQQWATLILETELFYSASRFRIIEGYPDPLPEWLEVFETDQLDPLSAFARSVDSVAPQRPNPGIRRQTAGSFRLVTAYSPMDRRRSAGPSEATTD